MLIGHLGALKNTDLVTDTDRERMVMFRFRSVKGFFSLSNRSSVRRAEDTGLAEFCSKLSVQLKEI